MMYSSLLCALILSIYTDTYVCIHACLGTLDSLMLGNHQWNLFHVFPLKKLSFPRPFTCLFPCANIVAAHILFRYAWIWRRWLRNGNSWKHWREREKKRKNVFSKLSIQLSLSLGCKFSGCLVRETHSSRLCFMLFLYSTNSSWKC